MLGREHGATGGDYLGEKKRLTRRRGPRSRPRITALVLPLPAAFWAPAAALKGVWSARATAYHQNRTGVVGSAIGLPTPGAGQA